MGAEMDLILWRHADAGDALAGAQEDFARPLSDRGRKQAARVARWLLARLPERCTVISSPAPRARQTADALGLKVRVDDRLAPGAPGSVLLEVAGWPHGLEGRARHVVLVGHQPSLGEAVSLAISGASQPWTVRKASAVWLASRQTDDLPNAYLRAAIGADMV